MKITKEYLITKIEKEEGLYRKKANPLLIGIWESFEDNEPGGFLDLNKSFSGKTLARVRVTILSETEDGIETKIELYLNSYCTWETFFEGWLEIEEDIDSVLRMLGL